MKLKLHHMPIEARRIAHRAYLEDHATSAQIAALLRAAGYPISESSVHRYISRISGELNQIALEAQTEALAQRVSDLVVEKLLATASSNEPSTARVDTPREGAPAPSRSGETNGHVVAGEKHV